MSQQQNTPKLRPSRKSKHPKNIYQQPDPQDPPQDDSTDRGWPCNSCGKALELDQGWLCSVCPDTKFCDECAQDKRQKEKVGCGGHELRRYGDADVDKEPSKKKGRKKKVLKRNTSVPPAEADTSPLVIPAAGASLSGSGRGPVASPENPSGGKRRPFLKLVGPKKTESQDEMPPKVAPAAGGGKDVSKIPNIAPPMPPSAPAPSTKRLPRTKSAPKKNKSADKNDTDTAHDTPLPQSLYHLERAHAFLARGNHLTFEEKETARALQQSSTSEPGTGTGKLKPRKPLPGPQQKFINAVHMFKGKNYTDVELAAGNVLAINDVHGTFNATIVEEEKAEAGRVLGGGGELKPASRPALAEKGVLEVAMLVRREICRGLAGREIGMAVEALKREEGVLEGAVERLRRSGVRHKESMSEDG